MDDVGQRGGGVFFTLTFSQAAYSFKGTSSCESRNNAEFHIAVLPVFTLV